MERVVRYADIGHGRRPRTGNDPPYQWQGVTLRPTGVVVFATLDRSGPDGAGRLPGEPGGRARPALARVGGTRSTTRTALTAATGHRTADVAVHDWRRRALRSVSWLLGR